MNAAKFLTGIAIVLLNSVSGFGQVSADSVNLLKQQKQSLELSSRINEHRLQLAKLENSIADRTRAMEATASDAQKAAADNAAAAEKLARDAQDKKLAKKARKAARHAESCAKKARNASDDLSSLNKGIENLRRKIADDEAKLSSNPVQP